MRIMTTSVLFWLKMALGLSTTLGYTERNSQNGMLHGTAETTKAVPWFRGSYFTPTLQKLEGFRAKASRVKL